MKTLTLDSLFTNSAEFNFSAFIAPLGKDEFNKIATELENHLKVFNQTLALLDNAADSKKFALLLDEILAAISLKIGKLIGADHTTILIFDCEKNEFWSNVAKDEKGNSMEVRFPAHLGVAGEIIAHKAAARINADAISEDQIRLNRELNQKNSEQDYSLMALPLLKENGEVAGIIQFNNKLKQGADDADKPLAERVAAEGFNGDDENTVLAFAPSIRLILEAIQAFHIARQKQRAATSLMKAISSLSQSGLDLEETLKKVMDEAKELMQADRSTLWLVDRNAEQLWTRIPINGALTEIRIPIGAGFAGQVATTSAPVNITFDLYNHPNAETAKKTDQKTGYRTCSLLCLPVFNAGGELIGVTQLINKKRQGDFPAYDPANWPKAPDCWKASFNQADQDFMQAFNTQAGVALQNAKLFATVKQQAQMQRDILRSLTNGVISTDQNGKIIAANESAKQLLGFDAQATIDGRLMNELIKIKEGDFTKWLEAALSGETEKARQQYYPEQTLLSEGGEQHSLNLSINSITDGSDSAKVCGALVVMDDISDEKRLKSTMYRYMSQELAEQLLQTGDSAKLGGDRKEVSVLFSDIRSYTTLTESMEAEEVVNMLNEYFESMVEAIFKNKGTLDKYIGDAIMAVFGSPLPLEDHAWCAVQAAIEMRHRLSAFNTPRIAKNMQVLKVGIGINSDSVISGNIGSSKRMEFTAIGDGINLGSRLEGVSKLYGCDIIISANTYGLCKDKVWCRELDRIRVKGKNEPVSIYELVEVREGPLAHDLTKEKLAQIDAYKLGREFYLEGKFEAAIEAFNSALAVVVDDKASKLFIERCRHLLAEPPGKNWDGVWTLTEK
jgi:adenylate cyclase